VRPASISPVRVGTPENAPAAAPKPAPKPASESAEKSAAPVAKPARTAEPARAPEPRRAERLPPTDLPEIAVTQLRWHPEARRRSASLQLEMRSVEDAREGDIVEGVVIEEILPDAIVVRAGDALHRIALQP
jgi:hypothetical protein